MSVYFIQARNDGPVKIGFTSAHPMHKLATLQSYNHDELSVIGFIEGATYADETALHHRFAAERIRGEWFEPSAEIIALASQHKVAATPKPKRPCLATKGHKKLLRFMGEKNVTQTDLARRVGVSTSCIGNIAQITRRPSFELAALIEAETNGFVARLDWTHSEVSA